MNKKRNLWTIIFMIVSIGIFGGAFLITKQQQKSQSSEKEKYTTHKIQNMDPLIFKGKAQADDSYEVFADTTKGKIETINVQDGQSVEAGALLLTYNNDTVQEQIDEQERMKTRKQNVINQLNQQIATAQNNLKQIQKAQAEGKNVVNSGPDLASLNQSLQEAQADLQETEASLASLRGKVKTEVKSEKAGIATINQEGKTNPQVPVIQITSQNVQVVGQVSEYDYDKLSVSQEVLIKSVNNDKEVKGKIIGIDTLPEKGKEGETGSLVMYQFKVKPNESIHYGYNVQIKLPQNKLTVPKSAVKEENKEKYVFVYKNNKVMKRIIAIEKQDDLYIIKSGLKVGEKVIEHPDSALKSGQKVEVR